jgi:hypothetical protein
MKRREIEFFVGGNGCVETTVKGVKGQSCRKIIEQMEDLGRLINLEPTDEFYAREKASVYIDTCDKRE